MRDMQEVHNFESGAHDKRPKYPVKLAGFWVPKTPSSRYLSLFLRLLIPCLISLLRCYH